MVKVQMIKRYVINLLLGSQRALCGCGIFEEWFVLVLDGSLLVRARRQHGEVNVRAWQPGVLDAAHTRLPRLLLARTMRL